MSHANKGRWMRIWFVCGGEACGRTYIEEEEWPSSCSQVSKEKNAGLRISAAEFQFLNLGANQAGNQLRLS